MNSTTVVVSIGRNIGPDPMRDLQWERFVARTEAIVLSACNSFDDIHFTGVGRGWYQGQAEESFTVIATIDACVLGELRARLGVLAHLFSQEAIAVTEGQTTIVEAVKGRRG